MGMRDRPELAACLVDRPVNRKIRTRSSRRPRFAIVFGQGDNDEISGIQLVLSSTGRTDQDPILTEPGREVALRREDQPSGTKAATRLDQGIPLGRLVHASILLVPDRPPEVSSSCSLRQPQRLDLRRHDGC